MKGDNKTEESQVLTPLIETGADTNEQKHITQTTNDTLLAAELIGAFKGVELSKALQVAAQAEILEKIHSEKLYKKLGYTDFKRFVKERLGISGSLVYDVLQQRERLGATVYEALIACQLDYKVIKAIASPGVAESGEGPALKIGDKKIDIIPENKTAIQSAVKEILDEIRVAKKDTIAEMEMRVKAQNELEALKKVKTVEIPDDKEYKHQGDVITQKFDALIADLREHQRPALVDVKKWGIYRRSLAVMNAAWEDAWDFLNSSVVEE
jgi:hypothetical protein